jgi:hypothetical protein
LVLAFVLFFYTLADFSASSSEISWFHLFGR